MGITPVLFAAFLLFALPSQGQSLTCTSSKDCASDQCCGYGGHSLVNVLQRQISRTCVALSGLGGQCPASGVPTLVEVCGCQSGLVCYIAPSGMVPMYGRCITKAQYAIEQQKLKDNPWLMMLPAANLGRK